MAQPDDAPCGRPRLRGRLRGFAAVVLLLAVGCDRRPPSPLEELVAAGRPTGLKVLIVGIDGATFRVLDPLLESGELPVLEQLVDRGCRGVLSSEEPMISPALWTTIATGLPRERHGITSFTVGDDDGKQAPVSSLERRAPALWNLVGPFGLEAGFVGWWATWPAEEMRGFLVSDRMTRSRWIEWADGGRSRALTSPAGLADELERLIVDPDDPPLAEIEELVALSPAERQVLVAADKPLKAHWPSVLKFGYCSQRSYERIALHLLARVQPDLAAVMLLANDPVCHTSWHYYDPQSFDGVDAVQAARLGRLIPGLQIHNDRFLGRLLELVDPETVVLVLSDHGFQADVHAPTARRTAELSRWLGEGHDAVTELALVGATGTHHPDGVLIAAGGPIVRGADFTAELYDITPTVLALLGLPVAEDMPGRVLSELIDRSFLDRHPVRRIPSYADHLRMTWPAVAADGDDSEALEMLRALEYIE